MIEHPAPWWYRLAARYFPDRCREIPEARNPERVVLRQVALVKRYVYLQQFASPEDPRFMHSHQWHRTFAFGLWGSYREARRPRRGRHDQAPVQPNAHAPARGSATLMGPLVIRESDAQRAYAKHIGRSREELTYDEKCEAFRWWALKKMRERHRLIRKLERGQ